MLDDQRAVIGSLIGLDRADWISGGDSRSASTSVLRWPTSIAMVAPRPTWTVVGFLRETRAHDGFQVRTEGFNNKAKLVKKRAYGYRSFRNYRLRLLNACA